MKIFKGIAIGTLAATCALAFASCGKKDDGAIKDKDEYNVGILQLLTHEALGKATDGFKEYINENTPEGKKVNFDFQNPEGDQATMLTMANKLVRNCDLVMGNATPAITQLISSANTEGKKKRPLLFTSVTDPVVAELVPSWTSHKKKFVTGTSDINPIEQQIELMFEVDSTVDKVGFLYNISEINSKTQCDTAKDYITKNHSTVRTYTQTVSEQGQIAQAVATLINDGCKAIYLPTDNLIASNIPVVTNVTNPAHVPVYCGESGMVSNGGTFTFSIDYKELGRTTGKMACDIMFNHISADEIAVEAQTDTTKMEFAINKQAVQSMGITLSSQFKAKYNITD